MSFVEFKHGAFTAKKTGQPFSAISLDQEYEQINALVKGEDGAVGLTENPGALRRWMAAEPEIARLVAEFEENFDENGTILDVTPLDRHHEQTKSVQKKFVHYVQSLATVMVECLKSNSRSIGDTIPCNNLAMISKPHMEKIKVAGRLTELKNDRALFSRLYVASQTREGDGDEFFRHENQSTPPSLAIRGQMCQGDKHNLLDCLEGTVTNRHDTSLDVGGKVL